MADPVVTTDALRKEYGATVAVDDVSLTIERGEIFALLGPNGAGKTTLVEVLEGLRTPTGGSATICGHVLADRDAIATRIGVVLTGVLVVAHLVFGVTAVPGPLALGLVVLGAIATAAAGMVVAGVVSSPESAVSLGGAVALPLMFVSGIFWDLDLMGPRLQTAAEFSPATHFHRGLRQLMIVESTTGVGPTALLLAVVAVVMIGLAVRVTDWQSFD